MWSVRMTIGLRVTSKTYDKAVVSGVLLSARNSALRPQGHRHGQEFNPWRCASLPTRAARKGRMTLYDIIPDKLGRIHGRGVRRRDAPAVGRDHRQACAWEQPTMENEPQIAIVDLLADLRHLAHKLRANWYELDRSAHEFLIKRGEKL